MTSPDIAETVPELAASEVVKGAPYKPDDKITFRVTSAEKLQMKEAAEKLGLSVTDYLLRLHRAAKNVLEDSE